ncbi:MAG TPA: DUF108 domain-containing protein [Candidatus Omnitrophota bacterium]|jgi:aspartate dehydrogenase|nr:DUF108 domain-containing protein [Candidatus Omnitrophota bacterium]
MKRSDGYELNIGILGCGAIGSRIAHSITDEMKMFPVSLAGLYDIDTHKSKDLAAQLKDPSLAKATFQDLLDHSNFIVEAVSSTETVHLIETILAQKKDVLVISVGQLLNADHLFKLAKSNQCRILVPSGAIAGIDSLKACAQIGFSQITLTTRKPISGFKNNPYIMKKGIILEQIQEETVIFDGTVDDAVKAFPQNINVAATLALATRSKDKIRVRISASPKFTKNSHEIEAVGDFGRLLTRTENAVCPDNPKTSYLAVLSAIETLKGHCGSSRIGT